LGCYEQGWVASDSSVAGGLWSRYLDKESSEFLEKLADKLKKLANAANDKVDQSGSLAWFTPFQMHIFIAAEHAEKAKLQNAES